MKSSWLPESSSAAFVDDEVSGWGPHANRLKASGLLVVPDGRRMQGRYVKKGEVLAYVIEQTAPMVRVAVPSILRRVVVIEQKADPPQEGGDVVGHAGECKSCEAEFNAETRPDRIASAAGRRARTLNFEL